MKDRSCPKCNDQMIQGYIPDLQGFGLALLMWYKGPPKRGFLYDSLNLEGQGVPIGAYRCIACSYLELYASEDFRATR